MEIHISPQVIACLKYSAVAIFGVIVGGVAAIIGVRSAVKGAIGKGLNP